MAYNTKPIITDVNGNPISQYYDPITDTYKPVEGSNGANKVMVQNNDLSLLPILDKLSQLTGTIIDEDTRKSNELQRIALYNIIETKFTNGELHGDDFQFKWAGTSLGVKTSRETTYSYVNLKGNKGDRGSDGLITVLDNQFALTIKEDGNLYIVYDESNLPPNMYINGVGELILVL